MTFKKSTFHSYLPDTGNPNALCFSCKFSQQPDLSVVAFLGRTHRDDGTDIQVHWTKCNCPNCRNDYTMARDSCKFFILDENE